MKVLVLDIDGVLNSHLFLYPKVPHPPNIEFEGNEHYMFDPLAVARVNHVIEATGARVVISSSWRNGWTFERLKEILNEAGLIGEVIGITPTLPGLRRRGDEISQWLAEHPEVTKFIAIDDDADDSDIMTNHLVKTSFYRGMQDEHVEEAIRRLL